MSTGRTGSKPRLAVGFHTGAFHSAYYSFPRTVRWAQKHGIREIECGFIDGVTWNHGLGYFPHVASWEDPKAVAEMLDSYNVTLSQIDAAFPLSAAVGDEVAVPYVNSTIRWCALAGCPMVDTTDGLHKPEGIDERTVMKQMKERYLRIVDTAARYGITVNIETHGHFTANPDFMAEMLDFVDSPFLRMTFDTGNVFIAGQEPPAFLDRFVDSVSHVHIKDVPETLAASARGKQTGIGLSQSAIGEGVNAENIRRVLGILRTAEYSGAVSLECDAHGGPLLERSIDWFLDVVNDLGYEHDVWRQKES